MEGLPLVLYLILNQLHILLRILRTVELVQQDLRLYPLQGSSEIHVLHFGVFYLLQLFTEFPRDYSSLVIRFDFLFGQRHNLEIQLGTD